MTIHPDDHAAWEDEARLVASRARRKAAKAKRALTPSEAQVANSIRNRLTLHGCVCQVNPNEAMSKILKRAVHIQGTILGFPDITVIAPNGRVAFLELKKPGAKPKNADEAARWVKQAEVRETLQRLGHVAALVRSQDEAVDVLRAAGVIR